MWLLLPPREHLPDHIHRPLGQQQSLQLIDPKPIHPARIIRSLHVP